MYEISTETYAFIAKTYNTTKIIETEKEILINTSVNKLISNGCKYFGSSYLGRLEGTKEFININYKAPIIVEESREIIFFPTSSPRNEFCHWLSLKAIKSYKKHDDKTMITFKNDDIIVLPISYSSFDNQYLRATKLLLTLKDRKEELKTGI